jgi:hypothetical protein
MMEDDMKTAAEMLDRMEALCRKMAAQFSEANSKYNQAPYLGSTLVYIDAASYREACAIVSELPEPVDPDILVARQILADSLEGTNTAPDRQRYLDGLNDNWFATRAVVTALRRAREEGVK